MENKTEKFVLVMRSKTTFKTDTEVIEVHSGQTAEEVATRIAEGYGATVESLTRKNDDQ